MYYEQKLAVALTFAKFSKSPNLELKLAAVMAKNDSVNEVYLRAAKTKSLYKNKVLRPADNSRFAQAIRLRSQLNLDSLQISKLYFQTNKAHELDGDLTFRLREFERSQLPSILRDDQYTKLLKQANHKQALGWAQGDWKELKERGISTGLDSSKVVNEIYNYDIAKLVLQDKYGDSKPLSTNLKELESPIPESLKRLKTARRYNNPVADKSSNTTYSW
jgi:hypothetical protein